MLTRYESVGLTGGRGPEPTPEFPKFRMLAGSLVYDTGFPFHTGDSREPGFESRRPHHNGSLRSRFRVVLGYLGLSRTVLTPGHCSAFERTLSDSLIKFLPV